ncbi:hypothetical protein AVEN_75795-1 [Araneus ventricosus]|uniref:BTB domain-containing protein n=1 Tax=Araneus ventricosus TaxID=182803 RepID=A0A4Y2K4W1_ARAVE|nr:hypothetical protein AVEN_75795-1 [Araneus ventricosus]
MATADTCKRAPLTCIWIIENFSKLTYKIDLVSPLFVADSISKAEWCIKIKGGVTFRCSLYTRNSWEEVFSAMDIEFSLLAADGSPLISKRNPESIFQIDLLTRTAFLGRSAEFLPNNTLTVQCRMWIKGREIPTMDLCYARTRLKTYTGSFTWPIEDFGTLQISAGVHSNKLALNERKVYPLKSFTQKGPFMALILYLRRYFESEEVYVDALIKKGRDYIFFSSEFSVIDANGEVIVSQEKEDYTHFDVAVLGSYALISKNKLIDNKNLFLPNDTLLLKGSFEACTGVMSSEIEYCSPNVSSIVKEEKEDFDFGDDFSCPSGYEEYFIKKVEENNLVHNSVEEKTDCNSCNRKCPLKAALRYLQNEATLSDVCLQIGTKLYPAHKNILCSRSPIFSRDIQGNIIEINGMDQNTLRRLLQYIYTDTVGDLQFENALDLFKAAADYQLFDLKDKCSDFLITNLSKTNVRDMLSLAIKYQGEKLEMAAREFTSGVGKKFKSTRDS